MINNNFSDINRGIKYKYYKVEYYKFKDSTNRDKILLSSCLFNTLEEAKSSANAWLDRQLKNKKPIHCIAYIYEIYHSELLFNGYILIDEESKVEGWREIDTIK